MDDELQSTADSEKEQQQQYSDGLVTSGRSRTDGLTTSSGGGHGQQPQYQQQQPQYQQQPPQYQQQQPQYQQQQRQYQQQQPQYQQYQQQQQFQQPYGQQYPPQYYNAGGATVYYSHGGAPVYYNQGGPMIVTVASPPRPPAPNPYPNFAAADVKCIGGAMDSMGVIAIVLESIIVGILANYRWCFYGNYCYYWYGGGYTGYWCGLVFIGTGVLAHVLGRNPTPGLMMGTLLAALTSCGCAVALFAWSLDTFIFMMDWNGFNYVPFASVCVLGKVIVGFVQIFLSIALAVKCSKGMCCGSRVNATPAPATEVQTITVQGATVRQPTMIAT